MKRKSSARIQAALAAQRACLEAHRGAETPHDVHRCRAATRRLRVIVGATRPIVGDVLVPLQDEVRWLAAVLGPVREVDVLLDHLRPQVETLDDDVDGAKLVVAALERQRVFRARETRGSAGVAAVRDPAREPGAAAEAVPETDAPLAPLVTRELGKLRSAAAGQNGALSDGEIDALRLRAKRARYTAELAGGARWEHVARGLARVQDLAGTHQDAVRAEEQLRSLSRRPGLQSAG